MASVLERAVWLQSFRKVGRCELLRLRADGAIIFEKGTTENADLFHRNDAAATRLLAAALSYDLCDGEILFRRVVPGQSVLHPVPGKGFIVVGRPSGFNHPFINQITGKDGPFQYADSCPESGLYRTVLDTWFDERFVVETQDGRTDLAIISLATTQLSPAVSSPVLTVSGTSSFGTFAATAAVTADLLPHHVPEREMPDGRAFYALLRASKKDGDHFDFDGLQLALLRFYVLDSKGRRFCYKAPEPADGLDSSGEAPAAGGDTCPLIRRVKVRVEYGRSAPVAGTKVKPDEIRSIKIDGVRLEDLPAHLEAGSLPSLMLVELARATQSSLWLKASEIGRRVTKRFAFPDAEGTRGEGWAKRVSDLDRSLSLSVAPLRRRGQVAREYRLVGAVLEEVWESEGTGV